MSKPVIVQERDVEAVTLPGGGAFWLLEDSERTEGLFGANRLLLPAGADGTRPHHHDRSTEFFYILGGTMEFVVDGQRHSVTRGGLVVVPPGVTHAFGAAPDGPAEFFAVLTPGLPRFEYFRQLGRIARGEADWDSMDGLHDRFDVHFDGEPQWR
ncbi:cupin domain-containing protein [Nocardia sp. CDC159]|uniref:Cupin domain-containing protein n=1 Tax=Nocardia pulmonis TaxID=2951408 RepID=A0A9X2IXD8_9NOCA|nr:MULTISPECIES: cupin domain-containing protein [Nocardia]MCM6773740.1 cupin domain-containing protein [Nocardia pulmonis]MCM6786627.1 cupin domain-containing protein [Nocardia sp. CDC159]